VSCQRVISGRRVRREAGREQVAYDVMRPKALQKRDEVAGVRSGSGRQAGVGSIRGSPYTDHLLLYQKCIKETPQNHSRSVHQCVFFYYLNRGVVVFIY